MREITYTAVLLTLLFGLSGCQVSKTREFPETNLQTKLSPDQGVVVTKVINASRFKYPLENLTLRMRELMTRNGSEILAFAISIKKI